MDELTDDNASQEPPGAPAWMATFADLSTLLLTFFVLLLSFANMDVVKFRELLGSVKDAFGYQTTDFGSFNPKLLSVKESEESKEAQKSAANGPEEVKSKEPDPKKFQKNLQKAAEKLGITDKVKVKTGTRGVIVRVREQVIFARGGTRINKRAYPFLNALSGLFKKFYYNVLVEGHTDNRPVRSRRFPSNWHLSTERAISVMRYLSEVGGIDPQRLGVAGYAGMRPIASNATPEGRAKNRRVDFIWHKARTLGTSPTASQSSLRAP